MSDEREKGASRAAETPESSANPGAPVEETEASRTEVLRAVERSKGSSDANGSAEPVVADAGAEQDAAETTVVDDAASAEGGDPDPFGIAERMRREEISAVDTQLDLESPVARGAATSRIGETDVLPSAAAEVPEPPARDGEIRISADHPMAALYMQSPMPPDLRGNRAAGVLIALLGAVAFAVLYAGIVSAMIARDFPPSTFLTEGLLPWVTSWGFIAGVVAFFVGLAILVLIFGRAGWWAYVIFSLFVGIIVWVATTATFALTGGPYEAVDGAKGFVETARQLAFTVPTLGAAILAREVAVWFGAWIGSRGRRMTAKNAALLEEYEAALAEVRAKQ